VLELKDDLWIAHHLSHHVDKKLPKTSALKGRLDTDKKKVPCRRSCLLTVLIRAPVEFIVIWGELGTVLSVQMEELRMDQHGESPTLLCHLVGDGNTH